MKKLSMVMRGLFVFGLLSAQGVLADVQLLKDVVLAEANQVSCAQNFSNEADTCRRRGQSCFSSSDCCSGVCSVQGVCE